ncbi:MAG: hypothetical protein AAB649_00655 [Patescibacteria group bacterium]
MDINTAILALVTLTLAYTVLVAFVWNGGTRRLKKQEAKEYPQLRLILGGRSLNRVSGFYLCARAANENALISSRSRGITKP